MNGPPSLQNHGRPAESDAVGHGDRACEPVLHIVAQGRIACKLARFRASRCSTHMLLRGVGHVIEIPTAVAELRPVSRGSCWATCPPCGRWRAQVPERPLTLLVHLRGLDLRAGDTGTEHLGACQAFPAIAGRIALHNHRVGFPALERRVASPGFLRGRICYNPK